MSRLTIPGNTDNTHAASSRARLHRAHTKLGLAGFVPLEIEGKTDFRTWHSAPRRRPIFFDAAKAGHRR